MKNFSKIIIGIAVCCCFIISTPKAHAVFGLNAKKEITEGFSELIDARIEEYLSSTEPDKFGNIRCEYALKLGLEDITYEIVDISRDKGPWRDIYVLTVEIHLTCEENHTTEDIYELANEIKIEFILADGDDIGKYSWSYSPMDDSDYWITIYVNGEKIISPPIYAPNDDKDDDKTVKCRRSGCGKEPVYTDWNRRYCSEHINDTHYCRHPRCTNQVPNSSKTQYCYDHDGFI